MRSLAFEHGLVRSHQILWQSAIAIVGREHSENKGAFIMLLCHRRTPNGQVIARSYFTWPIRKYFNQIGLKIDLGD